MSNEPKYLKSQVGEWFYLAWRHDAHDPTDDSIGTGSSMRSSRFRSEEAREYFIQAESARAEWRYHAWKYDCLVNGLRATLKKRNIRKRILELIG